MDRTTLIAAAWMLGAIASFTSMAVGGRLVGDTHDTFEIMLFRSILGLGIMLTVAQATGGVAARVRTRHPRLHVLRNMTHFAGQNLWFLAIMLAPLAQVFAIEFTAPLWLLLLAPMLLGERVRGVQFVVALVGFAGVLIVARPFGGEPSVGLVFAGLAAFFFAVTNLLTRRLTRADSVVTILLWLTGTQVVFGAAFAGWDGDVQWPTAATLPWICAIGVAGLTAHTCLTNALSLAPASTVMPVDFARLPLIAVVGAVLFAEPFEPIVLLGGAIVVGAAWTNLKLAPKG
ncbi:DMT family transporter [Jannaschia sp. LMIT008]|uniref:DMT family transporter n=1 Tax=Jannaschia maritima TaxID=3032585 RepID=UPI002810ABB8|nr:DMT family transporter [Jannaschia sp. LMIT008]